MLEAFSNRCTKENTTISLDAGSVHFVAKGSVTLLPGWRSVFNATDEEAQDEDVITLPALAQGDMLPVRDMEALEKQTKPRPLHTEASLLSAMESAGKECENEDEREAMKMPGKRGQSELAHNLPSGRHLCKDAGIGTPATRAAIIETLFSREYVIREKKALVPTNKGLVVYLSVKDKKIADVAMTGQWEHALAKIGMGEMDAATFQRSIEVYASQITTELLDIPFERKDDRPGCGCPKCKNGQVTFYQKVVRCNNEHCGLTIFRCIAKKDLTDTQLTALLMNGKTGVIKGFTSGKTGKTFDAAVAFDAGYKTVFRFEDKFKSSGKKSKYK